MLTVAALITFVSGVSLGAHMRIGQRIKWTKRMKFALLVDVVIHKKALGEDDGDP